MGGTSNLSWVGTEEVRSGTQTALVTVRKLPVPEHRRYRSRHFTLKVSEGKRPTNIINGNLEKT